jgi:hypothetical protein
MLGGSEPSTEEGIPTYNSEPVPRASPDPLPEISIYEDICHLIIPPKSLRRLKVLAEQNVKTYSLFIFYLLFYRNIFGQGKNIL